MNRADLARLYEYDRWANARMIEAASALSAEQLARDLGSSFPSVRDTLVHIAAADWIWLARWNGTSPKALWDPAEFPDLDSLRSRWEEVQSGLADFVAGLTDEALARKIAYTNIRGERWEYPLGLMMQHLVNHSTYHRGQVTTMLRQLAAKAVPLDFLVFIDSKADRRKD